MKGGRKESRRGGVSDGGCVSLTQAPLDLSTTKC